MEQALEFFDPSRAGGRPGDPISLAVRQAEMLIQSEPGATYSPASLARAIGVSRPTMYDLMRKHRITSTDFKGRNGGRSA